MVVIDTAMTLCVWVGGGGGKGSSKQNLSDGRHYTTA